MPARLEVDAEGVRETVRAFGQLERELRPEANSELRAAAKSAAGVLVTRLKSAAGSSPTPVARRVASTAKVTSDRFPTVTIGGRAKVGAGGAPAGALIWGSEHGGHNFAAGSSGGYWIAPAVAGYAELGCGRDVPTSALRDRA